MLPHACRPKLDGNWLICALLCCEWHEKLTISPSLSNICGMMKSEFIIEMDKKISSSSLPASSACCVTLGAPWLVHTSVVLLSDWSTSAGTQHNFLSQTGRCHPGFSFLKALYLHTDFWIYSEVSRVEEVRGLGEPQNYLLLQITRFSKLLNTFRIHYHEEFLLPLAGSSAAGILFPS